MNINDSGIALRISKLKWQQADHTARRKNNRADEGNIYRWTKDIIKEAVSRWMEAGQDRLLWHSIEEACAQQRTSTGRLI